MRLDPIHPFPARMAPEIVFSRLNRLPPNAVVLDPMAGSGTVLRAASELGHKCLGLDTDPLALLMSKVWTTAIDESQIVKRAEVVIARAKQEPTASPSWIADCPETLSFVKFWFEKKQRQRLNQLARALASMRGPYAAALRLCLSRIIVTKERGASVARDTSHSRPHRVFLGNSYDVFEGFVCAARALASRLASDKLKGASFVSFGDARSLQSIRAKSIDVIVTSPPYLNAIDYMRGHRLALVWLGFTLSDLGVVRAGAIGAEKMADKGVDEAKELLAASGELRRLSARQQGMVVRYALDMESMFLQFGRVLRKNGRIILVVADSRLKGIRVANAKIVESAAKSAGFKCAARIVRKLPESNRYLPTPSRRSGNKLAHRMKKETVLTFTRIRAS